MPAKRPSKKISHRHQASARRSPYLMKNNKTNLVDQYNYVKVDHVAMGFIVGNENPVGIQVPPPEDANINKCFARW